MELFKLDSAFKPGSTVKRFDNLIWAERFTGNGDFKVVLYNDIALLTALPIGVLVSHTDTHEVMIVENHEVTRDKDRKLVVTVSGRSFETFAENRVTYASDISLYNPGPVANISTSALISAESVASTILKNALEVGVADPDDDIPNLAVKTEAVSLDPAMIYTIKRGDVYSVVIELLKIAKAGIKTRRPNGAQTTLDLVIHDGINRAATVVFRESEGDFSDATYFWSGKGYKNYARVSTHDDTRLYRHRSVPSVLTGLDRRTMYVAAEDLEGSFTPGSSTDLLASRAQGALDENRQLALMTAKVTTTARPKFKIDYNVGDLVTAFGEFSISQTMRVVEHILTVDKDGIRGYPALSGE